MVFLARLPGRGLPDSSKLLRGFVWKFLIYKSAVIGVPKVRCRQQGQRQAFGPVSRHSCTHVHTRMDFIGCKSKNPGDPLSPELSLQLLQIVFSHHLPHLPHLLHLFKINLFLFTLLELLLIINWSSYTLDR